MNLHFVRFIRGLQNFLAIPIMNTLAGFMIKMVHSSKLSVFLDFTCIMFVIEISNHFSYRYKSFVIL